MAKTPRKGKDHPDVKAMEEKRKERAKATEAAMFRMENARPTPTQEENDLAAIGIMVDEKEDDGSGPTKEVAPHQYGTRRMTAGD